jgi:hypothetical protein
MTAPKEKTAALASTIAHVVRIGSDIRPAVVAWLDHEYDRVYQGKIYDDVDVCTTPQDAARTLMETVFEDLDEEVSDYLVDEDGKATDESKRWQVWLKETGPEIQDEHADNWGDDIADGMSYEKDPMAYYGLSRKDFI